MTKKLDITIDNIINAVVQLLQDNKDIDSAIEQLQEKEFRATIKSVIRPKKLKDKDAPKKPANEYIRYSKKHREEVKEKHSKKGLEGKELLAAVNKTLADMWKKEKASNSKEYKQLKKEVERENEEYLKAKEAYSPPSDDELRQRPENQPKERKGKGKGKSKSKGKKSPTAYILFCKEMRPKVKADNPDADSKDITRMLGAMWKDEYADDRKKWEDEVWFQAHVDEGSEDEAPKRAKRAKSPAKTVESDSEAPKKAKKAKKAKKLPNVDDLSDDE